MKNHFIGFTLQHPAQPSRAIRTQKSRRHHGSGSQGRQHLRFIYHTYKHSRNLPNKKKDGSPGCCSSAPGSGCRCYGRRGGRGLRRWPLWGVHFRVVSGCSRLLSLWVPCCEFQVHPLCSLFLAMQFITCGICIEWILCPRTSRACDGHCLAIARRKQTREAHQSQANPATCCPCFPKLDMQIHPLLSQQQLRRRLWPTYRKLNAGTNGGYT